jgi:hypothetical protein
MLGLAKRQEKKLRPFNAQSLTARERDLLALSRMMHEPERRLLLFVAQKLISAGYK